jgi:hypothetical protein
MIASRDIRQGERVFFNEGSAFNLVSHAYKERSRSAEYQPAIDRYAWPISSNLWATAAPGDLRQPNHSCWPNLWFGPEHSLDVYARLDIKAGEQLTMDHATFGAAQPFECRCGAASCRKTVGRADYKDRPELQSRYGTRVSHYVYESVWPEGSDRSRGGCSADAAGHMEAVLVHK